jgi:hypothetical protein
MTKRGPFCLIESIKFLSASRETEIHSVLRKSDHVRPLTEYPHSCDANSGFNIGAVSLFLQVGEEQGTNFTDKSSKRLSFFADLKTKEMARSDSGQRKESLMQFYRPIPKYVVTSARHYSITSKLNYFFPRAMSWSQFVVRRKPAFFEERVNAPFGPLSRLGEPPAL